MTSSRLPDFDESVRRAMEKWPNVPQCFGWLRLDRRGRWLIQEELITHPRACAFLGRNYHDDEAGRWFVQNGPQRVFVDLDYTPWVVRFDTHSGFVTHTGLDANDLEAVLADDDGNLLVVTALGVGVIDDRDLARVAELIESANDGGQRLRWRTRVLPIDNVARDELARRYGFVATPREAAAGQPP